MQITPENAFGTDAVEILKLHMDGDSAYKRAPSQVFLQCICNFCFCFLPKLHF